ALCPKCGCDDPSLLESIPDNRTAVPQHRGTASLSWSCFCNLCAHDWTAPRAQPRKCASIEDMIRRTGVRRDELGVLAEIGALASFGHDRRGALWQIGHAGGPFGGLG